MRKIITLALCLSAMTPFASAEETTTTHNWFLLEKTGTLTVYSTPHYGNFTDPFKFLNGDITASSESSFSASVTLKLSTEDVTSFENTPEVGLCISSTKSTPTVADGKIVLGTEFKTYDFTISGLDAGFTYYYRPYVVLSGNIYYGETSNVTMFGTQYAHSDVDGYRFVDLDLPSKVLWATANLGAIASADTGDYLAWGEDESKDAYTSTTYKFCNGTTSTAMTKYTDSDGLYTLEDADNAAMTRWSQNCSLPTVADCQELIEHCSWSWITRTNVKGETVKGYLVTSNKNGNSIFLPVAGCMADTTQKNFGTDGYYWCNSVYSDNTIRANYMLMNADGKWANGTGFERYYGISVRPVSHINSED